MEALPVALGLPPGGGGGGPLGAAMRAWQVQVRGWVRRALLGGRERAKSRME